MPSKHTMLKQRWMDAMRNGEVFICPGCDRPISRGGDKGLGNLSVDHIVPKSKGGTNRVSNFQPMHSKCNERKGDTL